MNIHDFDAIRPYSPEELPEAFEQLLGDETFCQLASHFIKDFSKEAFREQLSACHTNLDVQKTFLYPLVQKILAPCCIDVSMDASAIPADKRSEQYTYVSNHRDIVLDSALLDVQLIDNGFPDTVEIAIGDNLLIYPWIRTLVRINKSFVVQRSLGMREMLASSKRMSQYMHFAITEKKQSIWIAQREGRTKDSDDRTQESILKMMCMAGEGTPLERLKEMNIVPVSISYEFDPCDYLKAKEFQQKRDDAAFKKSPKDDLINMQTGIMGFKGHVVYRLGTPVNTWIDSLADCPKAEFFAEVARRMDREIHLGYEIFSNNYVAYDLLMGHDTPCVNYPEEERQRFESYLNRRIELIDLPNKDEAFLRERILTMYANPYINQLKAKGLA